jgi:transposase
VTPRRLVRLLMTDALAAVCVPTDEEEAMRDVVRAREDLRSDRMRAYTASPSFAAPRRRLRDTTSAWNDRHRAWLAKVNLDNHGTLNPSRHENRVLYRRRNQA